MRIFQVWYDLNFGPDWPENTSIIYVAKDESDADELAKIFIHSYHKYTIRELKIPERGKIACYVFPKEYPQPPEVDENLANEKICVWKFPGFTNMCQTGCHGTHRHYSGEKYCFECGGLIRKDHPEVEKVLEKKEK